MYVDFYLIVEMQGTIYFECETLLKKAASKSDCKISVDLCWDVSAAIQTMVQLVQN